MVKYFFNYSKTHLTLYIFLTLTRYEENTEGNRKILQGVLFHTWGSAFEYVGSDMVDYVLWILKPDVDANLKEAKKMSPV